MSVTLTQIFNHDSNRERLDSSTSGDLTNYRVACYSLHKIVNLNRLVDNSPVGVMTKDSL